MGIVRTIKRDNGDTILIIVTLQMEWLGNTYKWTVSARTRKKGKRKFIKDDTCATAEEILSVQSELWNQLNPINSKGDLK